MKNFKIILLSFFVSLLLTVCISPLLAQTQIQPDADRARELAQQAEDLYQTGNLPEAVKTLQESVNIFQALGTNEMPNLAASTTNLCRLQLELGQSENALANCQKANQLYTQLQDKTGIDRSQVYLANAWQKLGFYPRACLILTELVDIKVKSCQDLTREIIEKASKNLESSDNIHLTAWRNLGDNLRAIGKLNESQLILETLLQNNSSEFDRSATLLALGNTYTSLGNLERDRQADIRYDYLPWRCQLDAELPDKAQQYYRDALENYTKVLTERSTNNTQIKANLNRFKILLEIGDLAQAAQVASQINLNALPSSQFKVYALVNYTKNLACLRQTMQDNSSFDDLVNILTIAKQEAKAIEDTIAESYVLGNLGGLYEYLGQLTEAEKTTQEALYLSQEVSYLAYQWQWQISRILQAKGDLAQAITYSELAIKNLELVRKDLLVINTDASVRLTPL